MTIDYLIFTNETSVARRRSIKYHTSLVRICIYFDYPLIAGSARKQTCPTFAETPVL